MLLKNEPDLESRKAVISWISLMRIWILYFCRSIKTSEWRKRQSSGTMTIKTNRIRKGIRHKIITQLSFYDSTWNLWNKTQHKECKYRRNPIGIFGVIRLLWINLNTSSLDWWVSWFDVQLTCNVHANVQRNRTFIAPWHLLTMSSLWSS